MYRRLKPKPPTTQPWRNLQHSPPDSNQPASEELGTVQSGQGAVAALIEGNNVSLMHGDEDGSLQKVRQADLPRVFAACTDVIRLTATTRSEVAAQLELLWSKDRAMRLALMLVDGDEDDDDRRDAAVCLNNLLADGVLGKELQAYLRTQFSWIPLPGGAFDWILTAKDVSFVVTFFQALERSQVAITRVHDDWQRIPQDLFQSSLERDRFRDAAINAGVFRLLSDAVPGTQGANFAILSAYKALKAFPGSREVVKAWTSKYQSTKRPTLDLEPEEEELLDEDFKPLQGSRQAFLNALEQLRATKKKIEEGNANLARKFADELVTGQLALSGAQYAAKSLCTLAQSAKAMGQHSLQLEWALRAAELCPDDAVAHGHAADALIQFHRLDEALHELQLVETYGNVAFARSGRARILRVQNRLPEALQAYREVSEELPDSEETPYAIGGIAETLRDMWRLDDALEVYTAGTARFPDHPALLCGQAAVLTDLGRLSLALATYDLAISRFDGGVVALNGRATVLRRLGKLQEARTAYEEVAERFPADSVARCGGAEVIRLSGDLPHARDEYRAVMSEFPHAAVAYGGYADVLREMGQIPAAIAAYVEAKRRFPFDSRMYNGLANAYKDRGDFETALQLYDEAVRTFPYDLRSKVGRADVLKRLRKFHDALEACDEILRIRSEYARARNFKAALLVLQERFQEAEGLLPQGPPQTEDEWAAFHIRGMILLKRGRAEAAVKYFRDGLRAAQFARVRKYLSNAIASARIQVGKFDEAAALIRSSGPVKSSVSNLLLFHTAAARNENARHKLFHALRLERAPLISEVRDGIAVTFGMAKALRSQRPKTKKWIAEREFEAVLLEAA